MLLNVLRCRLTYEGQAETNAEAWFNIALRPQKPEGSLGWTAQDGHLDSHTAPKLCHFYFFQTHLKIRRRKQKKKKRWSKSISYSSNSLYPLRMDSHPVFSHAPSWYNRSHSWASCLQTRPVRWCWSCPRQLSPCKVLRWRSCRGLNSCACTMGVWNDGKKTTKMRRRRRITMNFPLVIIFSICTRSTHTKGSKERYLLGQNVTCKFGG